MAVQRRTRILVWQLVWMVAIILTLSLLDAFSYESFFALSFLSFLIVIDLMRPITVRPRWWLRLRLLVLLGLLGFTLVIGARLVEITGGGIPL